MQGVQQFLTDDEWEGKGKAAPNKGERMMSGRGVMSGRGRVKQLLIRERG